MKSIVRRFLGRSVSQAGSSEETLTRLEPPWKAKSVMAAGLVSAAGLVAWMSGHSPALFRFGGSYLGGFFVGWFFRRFVKTAALVTGAVILLAVALKSAGWITLDGAGIEEALRESLASLRRGAEGAKEVLAGYLPSAGAGSAGIFFGFRKR